MRKFLVISIPIFLIVLFILIMLGDKYLKRSFNDNDNIIYLIDTVTKEVEEEDWDRAKSSAKDLRSAWDLVVKRVQFSAEKDEINGFFRNLARLEASIVVKNKDNALMELNEAYYHWESLGK